MGTFKFDPLSLEFSKDPYKYYDIMRQLDEPYYYEDIDTWMLTKIDDVQKVAINPKMVRGLHDIISKDKLLEQQKKMNWHEMPYHERFIQFNLLESEGETHKRLRKQVFKEFTPVMISKQKTMIQSYVNNLLNQIIDKNEIDFVRDFASHIPGHIIGRVLGVPDEDCPQLRIWSEKVVKFFDVGCDDYDKETAEQSTKEFFFYLKDLLKDRFKSPKDDLITRLQISQLDGNMSLDELISTSMLILMAGHGSTIDVLGSGMHCLIRHPEEYNKLKNNSSLIKTAIQEIFRFEPHLPFFHRFVTQKTEVGGKIFDKGSRLGLLYGAANRDPQRFDEPNKFDITRNPNRHIAFGGGTHFCLGNHLAILDMEVIFNTLIHKFKTINLVDPEPIYKRGLSVRGPKSLKINWKPK